MVIHDLVRKWLSQLRLIFSRRLVREIHSWQDIENALIETRQEFHKTTAPIKSSLDSGVNLLSEALGLLGIVSKDTDDELYALKMHLTAFGRVIASLVSLESGFPDEAQMILRNALEWELIAVDIFNNKDSLDKWKKTGTDDLKDSGKWIMQATSSYERINKNEENLYPTLDMMYARHLRQQWKTISSGTVHAHSQAQIDRLFDSKGNFALLRRKTIEGYKIAFQMYQGIMFDISGYLYEIMRRPKYRDLINKNKSLLAKANRFADNYSKLKEELSAKGKIIEENSIKVSVLDSQDKEIGVSSEIRTALDKLGPEAEAKAKVGTDFEQVIRKMLQLLEDNGFEITKLKSIVTYSDTESGNKIENITIYYLD